MFRIFFYKKKILKIKNKKRAWLRSHAFFAICEKIRTFAAILFVNTLFSHLILI